jgi:hypothetical protein
MTSYKNIIDAIEELHSPIYHDKADGTKWVICNACKIAYPCQTIKIIEDEVGQ